MNMVLSLDELCEKHDNFERRCWLAIPLLLRVILSPILLVPYVVFEIATFVVFAIPYAMLTDLMREPGEE